MVDDSSLFVMLSQRQPKRFFLQIFVVTLIFARIFEHNDSDSVWIYLNYKISGFSFPHSSHFGIIAGKLKSFSFSACIHIN